MATITTEHAVGLRLYALRKRLILVFIILFVVAQVCVICLLYAIVTLLPFFVFLLEDTYEFL